MFHNQLDIQRQFMQFLPVLVKGVLGVDERTNMPLALNFDDLG